MSFVGKGLLFDRQGYLSAVNLKYLNSFSVNSDGISMRFLRNPNDIIINIYGFKSLQEALEWINEVSKSLEESEKKNKK